MTPSKSLLGPVAIGTVLASPAVAVFVSSNFVNVGNLAFNMLFSRWMGPELYGELALLLTIKLALLGITGSVQLAVSQMVADASKEKDGHVLMMLARANRIIFMALWAVLPIVVGAVFFGSFGFHLRQPSPFAFVILLLSLPFSVPLAILRGVAFGRLSVPRIVLSANLEMAVRLLGAIAAWKIGLGLEGIVAAIVLSIVVAWAVLVSQLPKGARSRQKNLSIVSSIAVTAMPFAVLQVAQVVALDGDILLAKMYLSVRETGLIAALSLFQRIEFFACFALASVLLPSVVQASRNGRSVVSVGRPIGWLFLVVALPFVLSALFAPQLSVTLLVGPEYEGASSVLWLAALAAVAFTLNFLLATFLAGIGDFQGIYATALGALFQMGTMAVSLEHFGSSLETMLTAKAAVQIVLAIGLGLYTQRRLRPENIVPFPEIER
jgi:O-antigen/teichoic acid export membrane protein